MIGKRPRSTRLVLAIVAALALSLAAMAALGVAKDRFREEAFG